MSRVLGWVRGFWCRAFHTKDWQLITAVNLFGAEGRKVACIGCGAKCLRCGELQRMSWIPVPMALDALDAYEKLGSGFGERPSVLADDIFRDNLN